MLAVANWVPTDGTWHRSADPSPQRGYPTGMSVRTLCGRQVVTDHDRRNVSNTCATCSSLASRSAVDTSGGETDRPAPEVRYVRYRRGEVGESQRSVHVALPDSDDLLTSACGQRFRPARMEEAMHGMPCIACIQRLASAEHDRLPQVLLDEHGEGGLPDGHGHGTGEQRGSTTWSF